MNKKLFNQIIAQVAELYGITEKKLLSRSNKETIVEPRYVIWVTAHALGMKPAHIRDFTAWRGLSLNHSTILRGIERGKGIVDSDARVAQLYNQVINQNK